MAIGSLSVELLAAVLEWLCSGEDLLAAAGTCRAWRGVLNLVRPKRLLIPTSDRAEIILGVLCRTNTRARAATTLVVRDSAVLARVLALAPPSVGAIALAPAGKIPVFTEAFAAIFNDLEPDWHVPPLETRVESPHITRLEVVCRRPGLLHFPNLTELCLVEETDTRARFPMYPSHSGSTLHGCTLPHLRRLTMFLADVTTEMRRDLSPDECDFVWLMLLPLDYLHLRFASGWYVRGLMRCRAKIARITMVPTALSTHPWFYCVPLVEGARNAWGGFGSTDYIRRGVAMDTCERRCEVSVEAPGHRIARDVALSAHSWAR
jgi:hypothetical protein